MMTREAMEERAARARSPLGRARRWLREKCSLFDVRSAGMRNGNAVLTVRTRWWAWPVLTLSAARGLQLRPRFLWPLAVALLLLVGLRQSARALVGRA